MNLATSPLFQGALKSALETPGGAIHPFPPLEYIQRQPIALIAPLGTGATMIARRLPWFMESLADIERTWLTAEYQAIGMTFLGGRPFRAPHHTVSVAGLIGAHHKQHKPTCPALGEHGAGGPCSGGAVVDTCRERVFRPGELQLARFGVLFLDEFTEFRHAAIESLVYEWRRTEAGRPWIVAHVTPCPCGRAEWKGERACVGCTPEMIARWQKRTRDYLALLGIDLADPERVIHLRAFTRAELDEISRYQEPPR